jgi:hypothetical protein
MLNNNVLNNMLSAPNWVLWTGLVGALLSGTCLLWWSAARRFERRSEIGVELFESHANMLSSRLVEGLATVVALALEAVAVGFALVIAFRMLTGG